MDEPHGPFDRNPRVIKLDAPATLTSRIEPKDTGLAFTALDTLAKIPGVTVYGGSIEVSSVRSDGDYLTLRMGRDVGIVGGDLDSIVKTLVERLGAKEPVLKLRLDKIHFPSGRELNAFCDTMGEDFDRVRWEQE
jgi:hypothetical protein